MESLLDICFGLRRRITMNAQQHYWKGYNPSSPERYHNSSIALPQILPQVQHGQSMATNNGGGPVMLPSLRTHLPSSHHKNNSPSEPHPSPNLANVSPYGSYAPSFAVPGKFASYPVYGYSSPATPHPTYHPTSPSDASEIFTPMPGTPTNYTVPYGSTIPPNALASWTDRRTSDGMGYSDPMAMNRYHEKNPGSPVSLHSSAGDKWERRGASQGQGVAGEGEGQGEDEVEDGITYTSKAEPKQTEMLRRKCYNCGCRVSPSWRKSLTNPEMINCNKCGIYERTHHRPRPQQNDDQKLRKASQYGTVSGSFRGPPEPDRRGKKSLSPQSIGSTPPLSAVSSFSPYSAYPPVSLMPAPQPLGPHRMIYGPSYGVSSPYNHAYASRRGCIASPKNGAVDHALPCPSSAPPTA
ncbi:hypothetical protein L204_104134 [Cryptococcus depauperatus]